MPYLQQGTLRNGPGIAGVHPLEIELPARMYDRGVFFNGRELHRVKSAVRLNVEALGFRGANLGGQGHHTQSHRLQPTPEE